MRRHGKAFVGKLSGNEPFIGIEQDVIDLLALFANKMLVLRDKQVSPWFPMALVAYPVWETVFSIGRRMLRYGSGSEGGKIR